MRTKEEFYGNEQEGYYGQITVEEEDSQEELLPCPFCGEDCTGLEVSNTHTPSYWVECLECEAQKNGKYYGGEMDSKNKESVINAHRKAFRSAINEWNRRVH